MAPIFVTTIPMPAYPSITQIFHYPTATPFAGSVASSATTPVPTAGLAVLLVFAIIFALLGILSIVWLCLRRNRSPRNPELAAGEEDVDKEPKMSPSVYARTHIIPKTWDSSHVRDLSCRLTLC